MNLTMIGNLIAITFMAIAVWLSMQWPYSHRTDNEQLIALALSYGSGLLTALSSQLIIHIKKGPNDKTNGGDSHDYKKITN